MKTRLIQGLFACGLGVTLQAAQLTFPIVTDAYLDSASANASKNYGAATTIKVLVNTNDSSVCRGLLQLPPEAGLYEPGDIEQAIVLLYVWQDRTTNLNITLFPLVSPFAEGTAFGTTNASGATWTTRDGTNAWLNPGGDFDTNHPVVGVKEEVLDPGMNDRFFSWDITSLLTNSAVRAHLLNHGALLRIDEPPPPVIGMPRAPFTSSDDLAYAGEYRPQIRLVIRPRTADVFQVSMAGDQITMAISNCTPFITNRIERSFDLLQANNWTFITNMVVTGSATNWTEPLQPEWTNVYYRITGDE